MSDGPGVGDAAGPEPGGEQDWQRRRRLEQVFGEALPEATRDDRDEPGEPAREEAASDAWLRSQVPPHHG